jgi:virginiamycin B lyase
MAGTIVAALPRFRQRTVWLSLSLLIAAGIAIWLLALRIDRGLKEYPMLVQTDIPTALDIAPDGTVWFTIEFSDAVGVFRDGRIGRIRKATQNLEPLGLAADASGGAWYTDTPARAISHITANGEVRSFPLSTPIARLGRLALAPDGSVWFADELTASVTRLQNGVFTRHDVGSSGGAPYGIAIEPNGTVWTTLQNPDKLGRIAADGRITTFDIPTRDSGLGDIAVDRNGAVWFLELRANQIGRFVQGRFTEFPVPTPSAGLTALAAAPDGSVWFTELSTGKLGRLRNEWITEIPLPRANSRPFGVAADGANNIWYTDLNGWLGMLAAGQAKGP